MKKSDEVSKSAANAPGPSDSDTPPPDPPDPALEPPEPPLDEPPDDEPPEADPPESESDPHASGARDKRDSTASSDNRIIGSRSSRKVPWLHLVALTCLLALVYIKFRPNAQPADSRPESGAVTDTSGLPRLIIEKPWTHFQSNGFVEMVPPLRLPVRDRRNRVEVWLRLPGDAAIRTVRSNGRLLLKLPAGSRAARVEKIGFGDDPKTWKYRVMDVRGTRFEPDGERFFVARATENREESPIDGWIWRRGSADEQALATRYVADHAARHASPANREAQRRAATANNDCSGCHQHGRLPNRRPRQFGAANRGTDASGCYQIQGILTSRLPIETYFPIDLNVKDPYISFDCGGDVPATVMAESVLCDDGTVPFGTLDVRAALAANDARVRRMCESRRFLFGRLDKSARDEFRAGFDECGIR